MAQISEQHGDGKAGLAARQLALDLLDYTINRRQPFEALHPLLNTAQLTPEDRGFAMAMALAALRHYGALHALITARLEKPLPPQAQRVMSILVLGLAQISLLQTAPHAAVGLSVELAKDKVFTRPYAALVNAVLRRLSEDKGLAIDPEKILPSWLMHRWQKNYGPETALSMVQAQLQEPPLDLSVKHSPEEWAAKLNAQLLPTGTIRIGTHKGSIDTLPGFHEGAWWVQDAGARLPVAILGDLEGKEVLDLCAAPGGKTAALLAAGAKVTALDRSEQRLDLLRQNLERLQLDAKIICADAEKWQAPQLYDAILLDAPCSSTGTMRRHPDIAYVKSEIDIIKLAQLQKRLLQSAAKWLDPGGMLVYATCSLEPEEGEQQVVEFLKDNPDFQLQPIGPSHLTGFGEPIAPQGWIRARPDMLANQGGIDGFFAAKLLKTAK